MPRSRTILIALAAAALLAWLVAVGLFVARFDMQTATRSMEVRLSETLGLEVRVQGASDLDLFPRPHVVLTNVVVHDKKIEVLRAPRVTAALELLPLLRRRVQVPELTLEEPVLTLRKEKDGSFHPAFGRNRKGPKSAPGPLPMARITVHGGTVRFADEGTGTTAELEALELNLRELRHGADGRLVFAGELRAERLRVNRVELREVRATLAAAAGVYRAEPLRGDFYGGPANGKLQVDFTGAHPASRGELAADGLSLASLYQALTGHPFYEGRVDLRASLAAAGPGRLLKNLEGRVRVAGRDLIQQGFDLDGFLHDYRQSQKVNLVDVGAFLVAGPLGALLTKGYDAASLAHSLEQQKRQTIEQLVFNWRLEGGLAQAEDVALRTKENRLAVHGAIDLLERRYHGLTLALLDREGCAELTQEIVGPLASPSVTKIELLRSLAGPISGLLRKAWDLLDPRPCEPFYQGEVAHPQGD
jgi:AsmA protein